MAQPIQKCAQSKSNLKRGDTGHIKHVHKGRRKERGERGGEGCRQLWAYRFVFQVNFNKLDLFLMKTL
jgi:hypothetical protein